ncbi:hypothetical protein IFM89_033943 [Coptis chinensis]|uniref:Histidine-containing phosphotransfer protein n=1 Tax=Coptis chinensis TaxID=261450 RepID=A0A835HUS5_9MAGN|nr:hypothetical protein IFM89_033943 [Coptis chinensis]
MQGRRGCGHAVTLLYTTDIDATANDCLFLCCAYNIEDVMVLRSLAFSLVRSESSVLRINNDLNLCLWYLDTQNLQIKLQLCIARNLVDEDSRTTQLVFVWEKISFEWRSRVLWCEAFLDQRKRAMAVEGIQEFDRLIINMHREGLTDAILVRECLDHRDAPEYVIEMMVDYCNFVQSRIKLINKLLNKPAINFDEVTEYVHKIKGSSQTCGVKGVLSACLAYRQAFDQKDKERCIDMLNMVKHEFDLIRVRFEHSIKRTVAMARAALAKFDSLLTKLEDEGILGAELSQLRVKNPDGLEFVLELMEMYGTLVQENIDLLNKHLCGTKKVFSACLAYRQAYDQKDMERCKDMVNMVKHEFDNTRARLEHPIKDPRVCIGVNTILVT